MKMTQRDYRDLRRLVRLAVPSLDEYRALKTRAAADPRTKDVLKRTRWDCYWAIPYSARCLVVRNAYCDSHIDTALKAIMKELGYE